MRKNKIKPNIGGRRGLGHYLFFAATAIVLSAMAVIGAIDISVPERIAFIVDGESVSPDNICFGETAAANVNRYQFKKTVPATYIFYERDHSLSMTASTFSGGQLVMFTGFGLLGGVAIGSLGVIGAGKMKKKKNEKEQSDI